MKVLIIEDETELCDSMSAYLKSEGYVCEAAVSCDAAREKIALYTYDLALVDLNLPDGSGFEIIRELRETRFAGGIIIISARDALDDRIAGLNTGADDYLIKPFHLAELNARVKSLMRRVLYKGDSQIVHHELVIMPDEHKAFVQNELLDLTRKEFDMLLFLVTNKDKVLSKEVLAEHVWGDYIDSADSFGFVYAHIKNLRKKLDLVGVGKYLKTVYGVGYKFTEP
jgi:DNA-binding response OmpR family regulator